MTPISPQHAIWLIVPLITMGQSWYIYRRDKTFIIVKLTQSTGTIGREKKREKKKKMIALILLVCVLSVVSELTLCPQNDRCICTGKTVVCDTLGKVEAHTLWGMKTLVF